MAELTDFIQSQVAIADEELRQIVSGFESRLLKKNKHLLRQGQVASEYIFIRQGGLRIYAPLGDREVTGWIALEGEFFGELTSLKTQEPTRFSIQAMEDTQIQCIHHLAMEKLYKAYPAWQEFGRKVWETAFRRVVEGILAHQTLTAEERYAQLLTRSDLVQRVPLKHLASFLGVTPTSLSRLRGKRR
jgi:CRP-like cAMP-binding protein